MKSALVNWQLVEAQSLSKDPVLISKLYVEGKELIEKTNPDLISAMRRLSSVAENSNNGFLRPKILQIKIETKDLDNIGRRSPMITTIAPTLNGLWSSQQLLEESSKIVIEFCRAYERHQINNWLDVLEKELNHAKRELIVKWIASFILVCSTILVIFEYFHVAR